MKTELVVIDGWYAIRRTRFFWPIREIRFLNFEASSVTWEQRDYSYFKSCLTQDLVAAKRGLARHGSNNGVPYTGDLISMPMFMLMLEMANTNEGMKDCLLKAKEFYLLNVKNL